MNFIDYILILIVGLSMVLSLWRGFVREIISLIGLVAAFLLAGQFSGQAGEFISPWIDNPTVADITGFGLVFVTVMIVVGLLGALIRNLVDMAALTATDRTLGVFFGAARGTFLIALCFLVYTSYSKPDAGGWLKQSTLAPYAIELGDMLGQMIPEGYPFSRQGAASKPVAESPASEHMKDLIPLKDREALKQILEDSTK